MRLAVFQKLDALAPAYLTRRRSGDLVGAATHDVELIEYFFAHTVTPAFVAVLVPAAVLVALGEFGGALVLVLVPFLLYTALVPVLGRSRIDRLSSRAREASGDLNAHVVDTVQGLGRDRRVPSRGGLGRGARRQGSPLLRAAPAVPARSRPPDGLPGNGHRSRRPRGDRRGRVARASGTHGRREPAVADLARAVRVRSAVGDRAGRPPARRHARRRAAAQRRSRRSRSR